MVTRIIAVSLLTLKRMLLALRRKQVARTRRVSLDSLRTLSKGNRGQTRSRFYRHHYGLISAQGRRFTDSWSRHSNTAFLGNLGRNPGISNHSITVIERPHASRQRIEAAQMFPRGKIVRQHDLVIVGHLHAQGRELQIRKQTRHQRS